MEISPTTHNNNNSSTTTNDDENDNNHDNNTYNDKNNCDNKTAGLNDINNPDNNNMSTFKNSRGEEARQERQMRKERNTVLLATRFLCANQSHMPKCISTFDLQRLPTKPIY